MAVCESCGARVQDGITICPECGRPVVKMKTSLGLKGENGKKPVQQIHQPMIMVTSMMGTVSGEQILSRLRRKT